jgi:hypothetical protein
MCWSNWLLSVAHFFHDNTLQWYVCRKIDIYSRFLGKGKIFIKTSSLLLKWRSCECLGSTVLTVSTLQFGKTKSTVTFFSINCEWWNRPSVNGCDHSVGFTITYNVGLIIFQNVTRYFVVNRLRARLQMNSVSIPVRDERFCFLHSVKTGYGIHAASYPMCTSLFSRCLKRSWHDSHWYQG